MDEHARRLSAAIGGLAGALRRAGAPEAESARLLELAAIASLQALTLREEIRAALNQPAQARLAQPESAAAEPAQEPAAPLRTVAPLGLPPFDAPQLGTRFGTAVRPAA
jgi:hypothetical protein